MIFKLTIKIEKKFKIGLAFYSRSRRQTYVVKPSTQILQNPASATAWWLNYQNATATTDCGDNAVQCADSRYRTYDGSCNNLLYTTWGRANTRYDRLIPPIYADGMSMFKIKDTFCSIKIVVIRIALRKFIVLRSISTYGCNIGSKLAGCETC